MQQQMQDKATRDKPGVAIDHVAKPAASLNGDMVMRRSLPEAALASAKPTAEPGPAPVGPDAATPANRKGRLAGPIKAALAGLRAWGSGLVPIPVAAGGWRDGLVWPKWGSAAVIFGYAYLFFMVAILAGFKYMSDDLLFLR